MHFAGAERKTRALQRVNAAVALGDAHRLEVLWQALIMPHRASGVRQQAEARCNERWGGPFVNIALTIPLISIGPPPVGCIA
jgi:hypothetical protein